MKKSKRPVEVSKQNSDELDNCPHCLANLIGDPIPKDIREYYSPPYVWRRYIAVYDQDKDRTVAFKCPDCGEVWKR